MSRLSQCGTWSDIIIKSKKKEKKKKVCTALCDVMNRVQMWWDMHYGSEGVVAKCVHKDLPEVVLRHAHKNKEKLVEWMMMMMMMQNCVWIQPTKSPRRCHKHQDCDCFMIQGYTLVWMLTSLCPSFGGRRGGGKTKPVHLLSSGQTCCLLIRVNGWLASLLYTSPFSDENEFIMGV